MQLGKGTIVPAAGGCRVGVDRGSSSPDSSSRVAVRGSAGASLPIWDEKRRSPPHAHKHKTRLVGVTLRLWVETKCYQSRSNLVPGILVTPIFGSRAGINTAIDPIWSCCCMGLALFGAPFIPLRKIGLWALNGPAYSPLCQAAQCGPAGRAHESRAIMLCKDPWALLASSFKKRCGGRH